VDGVIRSKNIEHDTTTCFFLYSTRAMPDVFQREPSFGSSSGEKKCHTVPGYPLSPWEVLTCVAQKCQFWSAAEKRGDVGSRRWALISSVGFTPLDMYTILIGTFRERNDPSAAAMVRRSSKLGAETGGSGDEIERGWESDEKTQGNKNRWPTNMPLVMLLCE
jgi:hypothetical protein